MLNNNEERSVKVSEPADLQRRSQIARIFLVLPAYNEGESLINLIHRTKEALGTGPYEYSIVVIDDGSKDGTFESVAGLSKTLPIEALKNPENLGLGKTMKRGLYYAMGKAASDDIIVTMDGDDTHPPSSIPEMVALIQEGFDVVIASRFRNGSTISGLSRFRELLGGLGRFMFIGLMPIPGVRDYTCGYRAIRASALQKAAEHYGERFMTESGFTVTADLLLRLRNQGLKFAEVPLTLSYQNKVNPSSMKVVRTTLLTLRLLLARRLGF